MIHCFHCGLAVAYPGRFLAHCGGVARECCCPGCQAVVEAIDGAGLAQYYHHRDGASSNPRELPQAPADELALLDSPALQARFVRQSNNGCDAHLQLLGISCAACAWLIERRLGQLPGVQQVEVNLTSHRLWLRWHPEQVQLSALVGALQTLGYAAEPWQPGSASASVQVQNRAALRRIGVAGLLWFQAMMAGMATWPEFSTDLSAPLRSLLHWVALLLTTPIVFYSCAPLFRSAWRGLRAGQLNMDVPASLAIGLAYGAGAYTSATGQGALYLDSVGMFALFLLGGRYLEQRVRQRAMLAGQGLARLLPATCLRLEAGGAAERVLLAALRPGDRIRVPSAAQVPADGVVVHGSGLLDEALLTGESQPQRRGPGDGVNAGTLNLGEALDVEVRAAGAGTRLSAILRALEQAQGQKPPLALWAERVAQVFLAISLALVLAFGLFWCWLDPTQAFWVVLAMLMATCPCALSLAIPTALAAATGRLQRMGLLVINGHVLESLTRIDTLVLDKTGTLSEGRPALAGVYPLGTQDRAEALALAGALQATVEHPLARAFGPSALVADHVHSVPGHGVEGSIAGEPLRLGEASWVSALAHCPTPTPPQRGGQWVLLGDRGGPLAWFAVHDRLRASAHELVAFARAQGWQVLVLSGDRSPALAEAARELGVQARGGLSPEGKLQALAQLRSQGCKVLVLGDGANDAPVLAAAHLSIAMGAGTDLAKARSDAVLLHNDLAVLPQAVALAKRGRRIVLQNLAWAALYNTLALPFAAFGLVTPAWAALGMVASSLAVLLNALRLGRGAPPRPPEVPAWQRSTG